MSQYLRVAVCCNVLLCGASLEISLRLDAQTYSNAYIHCHMTWLIGIMSRYLRITWDCGAFAACCSVLQRVAMWCSVLHPWKSPRAVAACCSVLQHVAACCGILHCVAVCCITWNRLAVAECFNVLQCVAICCSALHHLKSPRAIAACCDVLQRVAACGSGIQGVGSHRFV